jgi:ABC-type nitrate/sulfonate/bicarbonate transport system permease component
VAGVSEQGATAREAVATEVVATRGNPGGSVRRPWNRWILTWVLLVAWEIAGRALVRDPRTALLLPLPSTVAIATGQLLRDGSLIRHAARSAARVALGVGAAVVVGVPLGALVAAAPRLGAAIEAPLRLLRPIPPVAWVPLTILWFGTGELQQCVILFVAALFVVMSGTTSAVRGVPPGLVAAARNLGARQGTLLVAVRIPAALPAVAAAVREGFGTGWFVLVAAEFLSASDGLGVLVLEGRDMLEPARTFVGMAVLALCGSATDAALARLQSRLTRWT